jgi:hypothetical protein
MKDKWYNDPLRVGSMLFFLPPIGFYGMYKSEAIEKKWKYVTYGTLVLACILLAISHSI